MRVRYDSQDDVEIYSNYKRYLDVFYDDAGFPSEILAEEVEDIDDAFAQKLLREIREWSYFSHADLSVITAAIQRLSKYFPPSRAEPNWQIRNVIDDLEGLQPTACDAPKDVEQQNRSLSVTRNCVIVVLHHIYYYPERAVASSSLGSQFSSTRR